jgi:CheY-like chemotaxis protein
VDSKPGQGATFTLTFPASKLSPIVPRKSDRTPIESNAVRERGRVLVVDDESVVAHTLKVLLQGEHDLIVAQSGAEALELLGKDPDAAAYDVILCDLMMPGMTGMELFEVLRREHPMLARRVVFMTGGVSMLRVSEFLESVPNAKFEKPFDIAELRRTLHQLVASSRSGAQRAQA